MTSVPEGLPGTGPDTAVPTPVGQNASSGRSISARSVASAMARSADSAGRTLRAKNWAAATLPS